MSHDRTWKVTRTHLRRSGLDALCASLASVAESPELTVLCDSPRLTYHHSHQVLFVDAGPNAGNIAETLEALGLPAWEQFKPRPELAKKHGSTVGGWVFSGYDEPQAPPLGVRLDFKAFLAAHRRALALGRTPGRAAARHGAITLQELEALKEELLRGNEYRAGLPPLPESIYLKQPGGGLWELYHPHPPQGDDWVEVDLQGESWEARDPSLDFVGEGEAPVAIDFGTSSTVVAIRRGLRPELLLIGQADHDKAITPRDHENPTVLYFANILEVLKAWHAQEYRPKTHWGHFRVSQDAKRIVSANIDDAAQVASVLPRIKQWALREQGDPHLRLLDQQGFELSVPPLDTMILADGQTAEDVFNPLELYAYYLGLFINRRDHNRLFLKYVMTFPIDYPASVKARILESFRRGLRRSLPETLALHTDAIARLEVKEVGSEPAAVAACLLPKVAQPVDGEEVAFAVYDFGGGTADFDYGIYRKARTYEPEEAAYHHVIERFGASGNKFMGSENLIEQMAFLTFEKNLSTCRSQNVYFTRPINEKKVLEGAERLLNDSFYARANTHQVMQQVRGLWESPETYDHDESRTNFRFFNETAETGVPVTFDLDAAYLSGWLEDRVTESVRHFFKALEAAFTSQGRRPERIHILLAGNACRSQLVQDVFQTLIAEDSRYVLHAEFLEEDASGQTPKTAVALGLLRLAVPTYRLLMKSLDRTQENQSGPFQFFVGTFDDAGHFQPKLAPNGAYGEWHSLGSLLDGAFELIYSRSPDAPQRHVDDPIDLDVISRVVPACSPGRSLFVKAVDMHQIEVCVAQNPDETWTREFQEVIRLR